MDGCLKLLGLSRHYMYQPVALFGDKARMDMWELRSKGPNNPALANFNLHPADLHTVDCCRRKCLRSGDKYVRKSPPRVRCCGVCVGVGVRVLP